MATVIAAEDKPEIRQLLVMILTRAGHEVSVFANGRDAVAAATATPPDLILMDVEMPIMDGLTACRALRQHALTADVPIVIVSGSVQPPYEDVRAAGATDVVSKPFDVQTLQHAVAKYVEASA